MFITITISCSKYLNPSLPKSSQWASVETYHFLWKINTVKSQFVGGFIIFAPSALVGF